MIPTKRNEADWNMLVEQKDGIAATDETPIVKKASAILQRNGAPLEQGKTMTIPDEQASDERRVREMADDKWAIDEFPAAQWDNIRSRKEFQYWQEGALSGLREGRRLGAAAERGRIVGLINEIVPGHSINFQALLRMLIQRLAEKGEG